MPVHSIIVSFVLIVVSGALVFYYFPKAQNGSIIIRADEFEIGTTHTHYTCFTKTVLPEEKKVYITGFAPILEEDSPARPLIHHYVLSIEDPEQPEGTRTCHDWPGQPIWAWTTGEAPLLFPEGVGIELGGDKPTKLTLQVHYDNPEGVSGVVDTNGIEILVQKEPPKTFVAMLTAGSIFDISVASGEQKDFAAPRCTAEDTQKIGPITVFASLVHAHEIGQTLWMDHYRDGKKIGELNRDDEYDFAVQRFKKGAWEVLPGDELEMHCQYNNDTPRRVVGGSASTDEMCLNFMLYYPRSPYEFCGGPVELERPGLH